MTSIPYTPSDAWLLLSILLAASSEGATLEGLISAGDAINHAIFTYHELDGGLARLQAGGLVRVEGQRVFRTVRATRAYGPILKKGGMLSQMEAIRKKLGAPSWASGYDPNRADPAWSSATFSEADLKLAYAKYSSR